DAADIPAAPPPITTSRATCRPRLLASVWNEHAGQGRAAGRSCRDKVPAQAHPARSVESAGEGVRLTPMSDHNVQSASPVHDEIAAVVARARAAAQAIEHYTQEQVDELVT